MLAGLYIFLAYLLPLPLLFICIHYGIYDSIAETPARIAAIAATSFGPSAILLIKAFTRIIKTALVLLTLIGIGGGIAVWKTGVFQ